MTTDSAGKSRLIGETSPAKTKPAPLISNKLLLFMVAMVLANTGGNMYGPLLPLYLKELSASLVQIGLFFTFSLTAWLGLLSIIPAWFKFKLPEDDVQSESKLQVVCK